VSLAIASIGFLRTYPFKNLLTPKSELVYLCKNLYDSGKNLYDSGKNLYDSGKNLYDSGKNLYDSGKNLFTQVRTFILEQSFPQREMWENGIEFCQRFIWLENQNTTEVQNLWRVFI
jgi:hypothetical protein